MGWERQTSLSGRTSFPRHERCQNLLPVRPPSVLKARVGLRGAGHHLIGCLLFRFQWVRAALAPQKSPRLGHKLPAGLWGQVIFVRTLVRLGLLLCLCLSPPALSLPALSSPCWPFLAVADLRGCGRAMPPPCLDARPVGLLDLKSVAWVTLPLQPLRYPTRVPGSQLGSAGVRRRCVSRLLPSG